MAWSYAFYYICLISFSTLGRAQSISTTTPIPPLQWLNLTSLLSGSAPPPLKDATIAYDETTRTVVIFGGESEGGIVQSQTFLLNLNTLTWSVPSPLLTLKSTPPARSAAVGGDDIVASNRHGFIIIGGKGASGQPLSDVWEYDYINEFWSEVTLSPGGPKPRWGASGGIDFRTPPIQDPVIPGPNNTFYLSGGFDGTSPIPLSDTWSLSLSGILSSNLPNSSMGSWTNISMGNLPAMVDQAGTVLQQQIIVAGGCQISNVTNNSCAQQDSYVINTQMRSQTSPSPCPAPRLSASLVGNLNTFSTGFSSQVFLLLGTFNTSLWKDGGGLENGEVAVLDINTGSWSRILPAGDPGSGSGAQPTFPTPREGAAAVAYNMALVGDNRTAASDIIVFGGRDASGNYLSETWVLRAYNGIITSSNSTFSAGQLQTGIDASGAGVSNQYMTSCATAISPSASNNHGSPPSPSPALEPSTLYNTSLSHKLLSPLSVALLLPAILVFRLVSPSYRIGHSTGLEYGLVTVASIIVIASYGLGIAGLATSFTTITHTDTVAKRSLESTSSKINFKTLHGKAGLALFVGLYAFLPVLLLYSFRSRLHDISEDEKNEKGVDLRPRTFSTDTEVMSSNIGHARSNPQSIDVPSRASSPRARLPSFAASNFWRRSHDGRVSSDSESVRSTPVTQGFEVLNRPVRTRTNTNSTTWLAVPSGEPRQPPHFPLSPANLRNVDWLRRRRILNAVGELDYTLTQEQRAQNQKTTDDATPPAVILSPPEISSCFELILRMVTHILLLALCVLILVALWSRAQRFTFAIFLAWTLCFYLSIFIFAWHGKPQKSVLAVVINRLRTPAPTAPTPPPNARTSVILGNDSVPFPTAASGPYVNQPPFRTAGQGDISPGGPRSVETDDDDDADEDEDTRQRRIEDEMGRREVSIVTVPKRKLWITNPS